MMFVYIVSNLCLVGLDALKLKQSTDGYGSKDDDANNAQTMRPTDRPMLHNLLGTSQNIDKTVKQNTHMHMSTYEHTR